MSQEIVTTNPIEAPAVSSKKASKTLIRGSSLLLFGQVFSKGVNFLVQVLIVRYLARSDYGAFAYALSLVTLGDTIITFGLDRAVTRFVPIYHEQGNFRKMAGTVVMAVGVMLLLSISLIVLFFGLGGVLGTSFIKDQQAHALLLVLIFLSPVTAFDTLINGLFAVFSKPRAIFFRKYILGPGLKLLVVLLLILGQSNVQFLASGYLAAGVLAVGIYSVMLMNMLREQNLLQYFRSANLQMPVREVMAFTLPLLTSDLVYTVINTVDVILLEYFQSTGEVAGLRAVQPAAKLNQFVLYSFALLFTPAASRLFARSDQKGMNTLYWQSAIWVAIVSFPMFALTFSLAEPFTLLVFGENYAESAAILALLSFAYYFNAALGHNGLMLKVVGQMRFVVGINVTVAVVNLLLNLFLIPRYGALGAAVGTTVSLVLFNVMKQIGLLRGTGVAFFDPNYRRVYGMIAVLSAGLLLIQLFLDPPVYVSIALAGAASFAVFWFNRRLLEVETTFPELLKLPIARRLFGK